MHSKRILVCGGGGFIGGHLVQRLVAEGHWVLSVDLKRHEFFDHYNQVIADLREPRLFPPEIDEVYQLAAEMGGIGYIGSGNHDADVMINSALININAVAFRAKKIFFSSSACIYPEFNQTDPDNPRCDEASAYPAQPDTEYGWEKLFSERLYLAAARNYGTEVRIARFHNIFGPMGCWRGGREKAPAAICRKVAEASDGGSIDIWGDGKQTRSFLYVDECVDGVLRLMESDFTGPVNIGSEEMVTINQLAEMAIEISGKKLSINHIPGVVGVRGRNSDNRLIREKLGWSPSGALMDGLKKTYKWIEAQVLTEGKC